MKADLSPAAVRARLDRLRAICVPEGLDDGRRRLAAEARRDVPLERAAAARLADLRALCELTAYLHRRVER
jgi:hypothetical protein